MDAAAGSASSPLLRPRTVPQLFDAILHVTRAHAWEFFTLSLLFDAPVHVFRIVGAFVSDRSSIQALMPEANLGIAWWLLWNSLAVSACAVAACQVYLGERTSVERVFAAMRAGGWRLFGSIAAFELLVDGPWVLSSDSWPLFLFAFVFLAALCWCAPTIPAAFVERIAPIAAVRRALRLVRGSFWRVAACVWIVWVVTWFADNEMVSIVYGFFPRSAVPRVADFFIDAALYLLRGITLAVVYFDCRVRTEGYDVEHLLDTAAR